MEVNKYLQNLLDAKNTLQFYLDNEKCPNCNEKLSHTNDFMDVDVVIIDFKCKNKCCAFKASVTYGIKLITTNKDTYTEVRKNKLVFCDDCGNPHGSISK